MKWGEVALSAPSALNALSECKFVLYDDWWSSCLMGALHRKQPTCGDRSLILRPRTVIGQPSVGRNRIKSAKVLDCNKTTR